MEEMKDLLYARINKIEFKDFRNIENGAIEFPNATYEEWLINEKPSILGLYGQNGSGKSSVIMALGILKQLLSGKSLGRNYDSCIRKGCDKCTLKFTFSTYGKLLKNGISIIDHKKVSCYDIYYEFDIVSKERNYDNDNANDQNILCIENEKIKYRASMCDGGIFMQKQTFIDTSNESDKSKYIFGNEIKKQVFTNNSDETLQSLKEAKAIAYEKSQSFIFMPRVITKFAESFNSYFSSLDLEKYNEQFSNISDFSDCVDFYKEIEESNVDKTDIIYKYFANLVPMNLIINLRTFGLEYLQIIDTVTTGIVNINTELPLLIWTHTNEGDKSQKISLQMDKPTPVKEEIYIQVKKSLESISSVLSKIVPNLSLDISDLGYQLSNNNEKMHCFEIVSKRGNTTIPLKFESDGIRRIVSILSLLITVYNNETFTIAIDEIDSGIFEYLLGEILTIMQDSARGQLIFTSHNLRPLEVLSPNYLCFTTIDQNKRFTKLSKRGNSNLRDGYMRSIVLGGAKEDIYNHTDKYEIEMAFRKAKCCEEVNE